MRRIAILFMAALIVGCAGPAPRERAPATPAASATPDPLIEYAMAYALDACKATSLEEANADRVKGACFVLKLKQYLAAVRHTEPATPRRSMTCTPVGSLTTCRDD